MQWSRDGHAGRKAYLNYTGADGAADRIEVDLSYLFRLPLEEVKEMRMWQPGVMERPQARVVAIEEQLHPTLIQGRWPRAAELAEGAWSVVAPLLKLDDAEREYTDRLQAGELRPDLLFPDDAQMAERVRQHPALLWKAKNAASHARKATHPRTE